VSLHSPFGRIRSRLIPLNKRYPIKRLIESCKDYTKRTGRIITFEYVLIKDLNCDRKDALALAELLKGLKCKVNAISYNQIAAKDYRIPSPAEIDLFMKALRGGGINAMLRKSRGEDIDAGCGQLRISRL
jgi:23S rRNA (adenine2503-C2)-methyltransferase